MLKRKILTMLTVLLLVLIFSSIGYAEGQVRRYDLVQLSGDVFVAENEIIAGDVVVIRGSVRIAGEVRGDVVSILGDVDLLEDSQVSGDVVAIRGRVSQDDSAVIRGSIVSSLGGLRGSPSSVNVNYNYPRAPWYHGFFASLVQLLGILGLTVVGVSVFPRQLDVMVNESKYNFGRTFLTGFLGVILTPFVLLVLLITIVGIPVAILGGLVLLPLIMLTGAITMGVALGDGRIRSMLSGHFKWASESNILLGGLSGVLVLWLVARAPFVGWLVVPFLFIMGMGLVITTRFGSDKPWFQPREKAVVVKKEEEIKEIEGFEKEDDGDDNNDSKQDF